MNLALFLLVAALIFACLAVGLPRYPFLVASVVLVIVYLFIGSKG